MTVEKKSRKYKWLRRLARIFLVFFVLFLCFVLFVRSPWGQEIIVERVVKSISSKTNTKVEVERLFITFSGNVFLEGLYLEDIHGDTLVYSKSLEANLPLSPILFANEIHLKSLEWQGLIAHIKRAEDTEKFNFSFLLDAYPSTDSADTAEAKPMAITIGEFDFKNFKIDYDDQFLGIQSTISLGTLYSNVDAFDLENMRFELDKLDLQNTNMAYTQTKPFPSIDDTTATQLPYLSVDNFQMKNVVADYNSVPDQLLAAIDISHFELQLPKADMANNDFEIDKLLLKDSEMLLHSAEKDSTIQDSDSIGAPKGFTWPVYKIVADKINLQNTSVNYRSGNMEHLPGKFSPDALAISHLELRLEDVSYRPKEAGFRLMGFRFEEKSGFRLKDLSFDASLNDTSAKMSQLKLQTNNSYIYGNIVMHYDSVIRFINSPELTNVAIAIPNINFALQDAFYFQPKLAENEYVQKALENMVVGNIEVNGTLGDMNIRDLKFNWGRNTSLRTRGEVKNVTQPDALTFDFDEIQIASTRMDILKFVSEENLGISLPKTVSINAQAKGTPTNVKVDAALKIPEGSAQLAGNFSTTNRMTFDGNLKVDSLRLDRLLKNEELGVISFDLKASADGASLNTLNATVHANFSQLELKNYDFSGLSVDGEITNGYGDIDMAFKDKNLNLKAKTLLSLDSVASKVNVNLNLIGADLYELGVTRENIKTGLKLKAEFTGNPKDFSIKASTTDGIAVYDGNQYQFGDIDVIANIDEVTTDIAIESSFLKGMLQSNSSPKGLRIALKKQFQGYFSESQATTMDTDSIQLKLNLSLRPTPVLTEVFFRGVERFDPITLNVDFNAATKKLNAELHMPSTTYVGSSLDSLNIFVNGNATDLNFSAGLSNLDYEPVQIKKTFFEGSLKNKRLLLELVSFDEDEKLVHIASEMNLAKDTIHLHIKPDALILNKKEWSVPSDNQISIADEFLRFHNVKLGRNDQQLTISNDLEGIDKEHLGISFSDFKLQAFLSLLNPDEALVSGQVNGDFIIENPFGATGILADFKVNGLKVMQNSLGNLTLDATSKDNSSYDFNLSLKDGGVDLDLDGEYAASEDGAKLNLDLILNRLDLKVIEGFSDKAIKDSNGIITGKMAVSGTTAAPQYDGTLQFEQADFKVSSLNTLFRISEESIRIDNKGVYFNSFEIGDANSNTFFIDGSIRTKNLMNPSFDLKLVAKEFLLLNSTKEDNELFYGTASFDADVAITGDLKLPKMKGKLRIRKITDVTYVVPESQLDVEERDGVVIFVNRENPDAILTRNDQEETPAFFQGTDVKAILEIADDAVFHVVIDEKTGDNLQVSGDAALNLNIEPNGRINLSGRYELNKGHYETSLYNLVKRRFEINPGSTITWQGEPTDAKLDVTAAYNVETSASPLMTTVTSGQDASVVGKFRQVLPFIVYLNVDGELLEPKLSFALDMPEDAQGSIGGAVYNRVQQLNTQESELNKQVFSLLALNRFFPDSGSDGSAGGTAALARDNVNKVLSGELNTFSDKIFGKSGFELDFDLDSFTDYQGDTPQDRTQLNINAKKKLFDDRLIVTAGSAVDVEGSAQVGKSETPIIGNVSLEYLLTQNGTYRLKGFRKNEYQNIIDGQLIVTGVALIFNREFNKFSELFNPLKNTEEKAVNTEKQKKE